MSENWAICYVDDKTGKRFTSDGYMSESQAACEAAYMAAQGITVYRVWRVE